MAYELIALLTDDADFTIGRLAELLRDEFSADPAATVGLEAHPSGAGRRVAVHWGDWSLRAFWEDEPHVLEEFREIADAFAGSRPDRERIAGCRRRITLAADDDPDMDHFNDYLFIMERLGRQEGVILFDPKVPEFVEG